MKNFKDLLIWQKGMDLTEIIYHLTKELPDEEKYGLASQMFRSAVSIPSNIAEGSGRQSDKQMRLYLKYSQGSSFELETQLLIVKRLHLMSAGNIDTALKLNQEIQKMQYSFIQKLK